MKKRTGEKIRPAVFLSGDRILMYLGSDPFKAYTEEGKKYHLKDREFTYDIRRSHGVTLLIQRDFLRECDLENIIPFTVRLS